MSRHGKTPRQRPKKPPASRLPVLQLAFVIEDYERDCRRRSLSARTIRNYLQTLRAVCVYWEAELHRPPTLDDVTIHQAERYLDHLLERGKAPTSRRYDGDPALARESLRTYLRSLK